MNNIHVEASQVIDAPPEKVYSIIADYHEGHQAILPRQYFMGMTIKEGGKGAGTAIEVAMKVMGSRSLLNLHVSEPEPGRVLVETDPDAGVVTTFTVEPLDKGSKSRVTIQTSFVASPGLRGFMERLLNPPITRRIYRQELVLLANHAQDS
jgi:uncharacterized protein YndB with AHSA1/START domain